MLLRVMLQCSWVGLPLIRQLKCLAWTRYFSENSSQLPGILANVLSSYFNNSNLKRSPLIVTEYGR